MSFAYMLKLHVVYARIINSIIKILVCIFHPLIQYILTKTHYSRYIPRKNIALSWS